jgi:hypothetical protein
MDTMNSQIKDDKQRIIDEFKLFLSLKPSDKIVVEKKPGQKNTDKKVSHIENVHIMALACCIGDDHFIILDDKIIHINNSLRLFDLFDKDLILRYKNSQTIGLTYDEACLMSETLIMTQNICTVPITDYNKKNVSVSVAIFIGSNDTPFYWLNFTMHKFRIIKKVMHEGIETLLPINIGYYNRDNDCNIINDEPFLDCHEEMTRYEDSKCLLLYASLSYKLFL